MPKMKKKHLTTSNVDEDMKELELSDIAGVSVQMLPLPLLVSYKN